MATYRIPFNKACVVGNEYRYIAEAVKRGHISGDGPASRACQEIIESTIGVPRVLLTTSCTHTLEMGGLLLDLGPGDEFIVPSFTFVSTVNALALRGATPVFVDVRPDTLNLNESLLASHASARTRAIVPVHYAGVAAEMDEITRFALERDIAVMEDNAHGLYGRYRGRWLGTLGVFAAQSFHETKNFTCGEGGAFLINDESFIERAEIIREKGTDRQKFFRGQVDKYRWTDIGSSYTPSDILAAFLQAQLECHELITNRRKAIWEHYLERLTPWAKEHGVRLPVVPEHCEQTFHMFYLIMPSELDRASLIEHLGARGIMAVFHYQPLHLSPMGKRFGGRPGDCPVTEDIAERLVRLPFYIELDEEDLEDIVEAVTSTPLR